VPQGLLQPDAHTVAGTASAVSHSYRCAWMRVKASNDQAAFTNPDSPYRQPSWLERVSLNPSLLLLCPCRLSCCLAGMERWHTVSEPYLSHMHGHHGRTYQCSLYHGLAGEALPRLDSHNQCQCDGCVRMPYKLCTQAELQLPAACTGTSMRSQASSHLLWCHLLCCRHVLS
jgi:hypothetical protein